MAKVTVYDMEEEIKESLKNHLNLIVKNSKSTNGLIETMFRMDIKSQSLKEISENQIKDLLKKINTSLHFLGFYKNIYSEKCLGIGFMDWETDTKKFINTL